MPPKVKALYRRMKCFSIKHWTDFLTFYFTETPCDDADECTGSVHLCYLDVYKDICCASCADAFDPDAPDTCSYGDKETSCDRVVTELDCSTQVSLILHWYTYVARIASQ